MLQFMLQKTYKTVKKLTRKFDGNFGNLENFFFETNFPNFQFFHKNKILKILKFFK